MKRLLRLWPLLLVLVLVAGGYLVYTRMTATSVSSASSGVFTQIVQAKQGTLSSTVSVVGELNAVQSEDLSFSHMSQATKLAKLNVTAGATVKQGDVLASIDPAAYQQAVDEAQSALQAAQKTLDDLKAPATALELAQSDLAISNAQYQIEQAQSDLDDLIHPDVAQLQSNVADAQRALAQAQADLIAKQNDTTVQDQLGKLYSAEDAAAKEYNRLAAETYSDESYQDRKAVAFNKMMDAQDARVSYETQQQATLLSAQQAIRSAQQKVNDAQKALATAQGGGDKLEVAKAKLAVQAAQVALQKAKDDRATLDAGADATDLATAQANVDKLQLALDDAQVALAGCQLAASFDGTVLKTNVKAGDPVSASTVVLTVANLKTLQVVASIDETTIKRVAAGQTANMTFDAFPGQTFRGKVQSVPLQGSLQNGVMVYDVPISLEGADKVTLLVGMTANVTIQAAQATNALLVPTMALQKVNGMYQVLVASTDDPNGPTSSVPVEVGLSDGTYTQITKGLNVGDRVVVQMEASSNQTNSNRQGGGARPDIIIGGPGLGR